MTPALITTAKPRTSPAHRSGRSAVAKGLCLAAALIAVTLAPVAANAAGEAPRMISVTGEAERRVAPDMATLSLQVVTENIEAAAARREADTITAATLAVLRAAGIADADIDTTGLSVSPQYQWLKDQRRQRLTGYQVTRSIVARVLELDTLGPLLVDLTDAGVNRVATPRLGLVDDEAVYRQVLADAVASARERAAVVATTLGTELGPVQSVHVHDRGRPMPMQAERVAMTAMADAAPAPGASYSAGHITYEVRVAANFSLGE